MRLESWSDSNIGLIRKSNQDVVGCFPEIPLFIVADGMGGRAQGELAARMAVEVIQEYVQREAASDPPSPDGDSHGRRGGFWRTLFGRKEANPGPARNENRLQRLQAAIELANQQIFEKGQADPQSAAHGSMGTTVVVFDCALQESRVYWAYVGDSRLYRVRNGELKLLTADHTLLGEAFSGQPEIPLDLPHTNRLVRALGIMPNVEVSRGSDAALVGDVFLLCSDGVSAMVKPGAILDELRSSPTAEAAGKSLLQKALDAGGRDNASLLIVKIVDS